MESEIEMKREKKLPVLPPCKICGKAASGFHYGINSCGACKGFFLRSIARTKPYLCLGNNQCNVGPETSRRKSCQKCRFDKCLRLGMSKDAIKIGRYTYSKRTQDTLELKQLKEAETDTSPNSGFQSPADSNYEGDLEGNSTTDSENSYVHVASGEVMEVNRILSSRNTYDKSAFPYGYPEVADCFRYENSSLDDHSSQRNTSSHEESTTSPNVSNTIPPYEHTKYNTCSTTTKEDDILPSRSTIEHFEKSEVAQNDQRTVMSSFPMTKSDLSHSSFPERKMLLDRLELPSSLVSQPWTSNACSQRKGVASKTTEYTSAMSMNLANGAGNVPGMIFSPTYGLDLRQAETAGSEYLKGANVGSLHNTFANEETVMHFWNHITFPNTMPHSASELRAGEAESTNLNHGIIPPSSSSSAVPSFQCCKRAPTPDQTSLAHNLYESKVGHTASSVNIDTDTDQRCRRVGSYNTTLMTQNSIDTKSEPPQSSSPTWRDSDIDQGNNFSTFQERTNVTTTLSHLPVVFSPASTDWKNRGDNREFNGRDCSPCAEEKFDSFEEFRSCEESTSPSTGSLTISTSSNSAMDLTTKSPGLIHQSGSRPPFLPGGDDFAFSEEIFRSQGLTTGCLSLKTPSNHLPELLHPRGAPLPVKIPFSCQRTDTSDSERYRRDQRKPWSSEFSEGDLESVVKLLVSYHCEHIVDNNNIDTVKLKEETDSVYNQYRLQKKTFGELGAIDRELYFEIYKSTGLDVDGRESLLSSFLHGIHGEISTAIKFFRQIPGFRSLPVRDQAALVKGCAHEFHILGLYRGWDDITKFMTFIPLGAILSEQDMMKIFPEEAWSYHIHLAVALQRLDLTLEQVVLLKAIVATAPDRDDLERAEEVRPIYWKLVNCLLMLLWRQGPQPLRKFSQIMSVLTEMRRYSVEIRASYLKIRSDIEELTGSIHIPFIFELFF